jgi:F-type H+-transporting ATPase subunit b
MLSYLVLAEGANPNWLAEAITTLVGFLIFLWVLKKYAWGPITELLDSRQRSIEEQFNKVDELREQAAKIEAQYEAKMKDIEAEAREKINEALADGQRVKDEILARARQEAEEMRAKSERALTLEVAKARIELRDEIVQLTLAATEHLLNERLDPDAHRRLVGDFIAGMQKIDTGNPGQETN